MRRSYGSKLAARSLVKNLRFFSIPEIFVLYKAQVLSYIESRTPGLYHAAPSVLDRIDRVQRRFLRVVGFTELEALELYRLAPLPCRRDMAMLGVLHKISLGLAPSQLAALFLQWWELYGSPSWRETFAAGCHCTTVNLEHLPRPCPLK